MRLSRERVINEVFQELGVGFFIPFSLSFIIYDVRKLSTFFPTALCWLPP